MIQKLVLLALAGSLGTLARYGLAGFVYRFNGTSFPWGTVTVNFIGCFLAGLFWTLFEHRVSVPGEIRTMVLVGFMGAFTTFSTLILETSELLRSAQWTYAVVNVVLQNGAGLVALFAGVALAKMI
jgi:CrcB protein